MANLADLHPRVLMKEVTEMVESLIQFLLSYLGPVQKIRAILKLLKLLNKS